MTLSETNNGAKARYIMIGGFLGAGKTTSVAAFAKRLSDQGLKVGLITNDQGSELVDTAMLRSRGFATEEIAGGCFCCRFNSLVDAAGKLNESTRPDVFIAEPVGSCTDLVATVTYPLRRIYGDAFTISPLSVLVDPVRAMRVLGIGEGGRFSEKVRYIYLKQLEEADVIVINKTDLLAAEQLASLESALAREFPKARILKVAARSGDGLDAWFDHVLENEQEARSVMEVDYEVYAEGEALLGWLNATLQLSSTKDFDAAEVMRAIATDLQSAIGNAAGEIAHLKMTLSPDGAVGGDVAVINLVRNDFVPELSQSLEDPVGSGQLILNVRAELAPEQIAEIVKTSAAKLSATFPNLTAKVDHFESFRPGKPTPTHRVEAG